MMLVIIFFYLAVNKIGGVVNSCNPSGSTAFINSLALLLKITSLFMVLYSYSNSLMCFSVVLIFKISLSVKCPLYIYSTASKSLLVKRPIGRKI